MGLVNLTSFVGEQEKSRKSAADSLFAVSTTLAKTGKPGVNSINVL
jgi:hypothetical protein